MVLEQPEGRYLRASLDKLGRVGGTKGQGSVGDTSGAVSYLLSREQKDLLAIGGGAGELRPVYFRLMDLNYSRSSGYSWEYPQLTDVIA